MKSLRSVTVIVPAVLLAACLLAWFSTRQSDPAQPAGNAAEQAQPLVDTSLLQKALSLASTAATSDEQADAREARRLADHQLDLTFAAALRQAGAEAQNANTGNAAGNAASRRLTDLVAKLKLRVDADKKKAADLASDTSGALDLAHAQLDLDQDEMDDAQQDLARQGGDKLARLQRLLQEHEASDKLADQGLQFGGPTRTGTMSDQIGTWFSLNGLTHQLEDAGDEAALAASHLLEQHEKLEHQVPADPGSSASVDRLRQLSAQHKTLAGLDQRVADTRQLATVYQHWSTLVDHRRRGVFHLLLQSLGTIFAILLASVLLNRAAEHAFHHTDRRRLHQLRVIARITIQVTALLVILLVLFGPPTQLSTIIGLVTAGLTVVMKDFIVAFFGWFTLMGKNGIRVGDWVEIEGVSGEVIEIGLLKTALLELGNGSSTGLHTGRRVAFSNSFAMERHYFNFSTSGQWLWDELRLALPAAVNPFETAEKIREIAEQETRADATDAATEWQRVTRQYGAREFSATPAVDLLPAGSGLEVVVRYITRAPERNIVQAKLLHAIVDLLRDVGQPILAADPLSSGSNRLKAGLSEAGD
jgi:small-conductance mechanosensitive channel